MKVRDLTLGQLRTLCKRCDCKECDFFVLDKWKPFVSYYCFWRSPRSWPVYFDDRRVGLQSFGDACWRWSRWHRCEDSCEAGSSYSCSTCELGYTRLVRNLLDSDRIPDAWERILEDERKLMEKLREEPG